MCDKNKKNQSAFPSWDMSFNENPELHIYSAGTGTGMSKRFYAACAAMQGLISNPYVMQKIDNSEKNDLEKDKILIEQAYDLATELLK